MSEGTTVVQTPAEIEALKQAWIDDGGWDIETTDGFEAHHNELLAWRQHWEEEQKQLDRVELQAIADRKGITVRQAESLRTAQRHAKRNADVALKTLRHLFTRVLSYPDLDADLDVFIENVISSAVERATAERILHSS